LIALLSVQNSLPCQIANRLRPLFHGGGVTSPAQAISMSIGHHAPFEEEISTEQKCLLGQLKV
jgi:hypothetical protein